MFIFSIKMYKKNCLIRVMACTTVKFGQIKLQLLKIKENLRTTTLKEVYDRKNNKIYMLVLFKFKLFYLFVRYC